MATLSPTRQMPSDDSTQRSENHMMGNNVESPPSVFVNSEPIREDQVQNAVKFLSHPKVRGSPVVHRRSFLENKGLTKEEIDEAFRRVPDTLPPTQTSNVTRDGRNTESQMQPMPSTQTKLVPLVKDTPLSRFRWYHAIIALGAITVSTTGTILLIKKSFIPRFKTWVRKVIQEEESSSPVEAKEPSELAKAIEELLKSKNEEKKHWEKCTQLLELQVNEIKSLTSALNKTETKEFSSYRKENDVVTVNSGSSSFAAKPSLAPHSKSYMDVMAMIQRGERPPNIKDINDQPPNPDQPIANPTMPPRSKPWEVKEAWDNNGNSHQVDEWWQRKNIKITEIENDSESIESLSSGKFTERSVWVPPQPPAVVMPEAAEAIRRPKKSLPNDQSSGDSVKEPVETEVDVEAI